MRGAGSNPGPYRDRYNRLHPTFHKAVAAEVQKLGLRPKATELASGPGEVATIPFFESRIRSVPGSLTNGALDSSVRPMADSVAWPPDPGRDAGGM